jgi:hypothetical protein
VHQPEAGLDTMRLDQPRAQLTQRHVRPTLDFGQDRGVLHRELQCLLIALRAVLSPVSRNRFKALSMSERLTPNRSATAAAGSPPATAARTRSRKSAEQRRPDRHAITLLPARTTEKGDSHPAVAGNREKSPASVTTL